MTETTKAVPQQKSALGLTEHQIIARLRSFSELRKDPGVPKLIALKAKAETTSYKQKVSGLPDVQILGL